VLALKTAIANSLALPTISGCNKPFSARESGKNAEKFSSFRFEFSRHSSLSWIAGVHGRPIHDMLRWSLLAGFLYRKLESVQ
jgi:hypothetical protein